MSQLKTQGQEVMDNKIVFMSCQSLVTVIRGKGFLPSQRELTLLSCLLIVHGCLILLLPLHKLQCCAKEKKTATPKFCILHSNSNYNSYRRELSLYRVTVPCDSWYRQQEYKNPHPAASLSLNVVLQSIHAIVLADLKTPNRFIRCPTHSLPVLERRFVNCILTAFLLNEKCSYQFKNLWMVRV